MNYYTNLLNRRKKGGPLIEFVLVLPLMLFLFVLIFDIGRFTMANTAISDAASVGARAGARIGAPGGGTGNCTSLGPVSNVSYRAACEAARNFQVGWKVQNVRIERPNGGICRIGDPYVIVEVTGEMSYFNPLFSGLAILSPGGYNFGAITQKGIARCEVVR